MSLNQLLATIRLPMVETKKIEENLASDVEGEEVLYMVQRSQQQLLPALALLGMM